MAGQKKRRRVFPFIVDVSPQTQLLSPQETKRLQSVLKSLQPKSIPDLGIPANYLAVRGPKGGTAYLEKNLLVVKIPLHTRIKDVRLFCEKAAGFFKPWVTAEVEVVKSNHKATLINRGRYDEVQFQEGPTFQAASKAPVQFLRRRTFSQLSTDPNELPKKHRLKWLKKTYAKHKKSMREYTAATKTSEELDKLGKKTPKFFGSWVSQGNEKPFELTPDTVLEYIRKKS